jgi:hypothetical protein
MGSAPSTRALQRAKRSLAKKYGDRGWFRGVGIVPTDDGLALRLNVDPDAKVEAGEIPATFQNIAIEVVRMKGYKARKKSGE